MLLQGLQNLLVESQHQRLSDKTYMSYTISNNEQLFYLIHLFVLIEVLVMPQKDEN